MLEATLIAYTKFVAENAEDVGDGWKTDAVGASALSEFAGRACYQSWSKPNPNTATNYTYIKHILEVGHDSVLRHGTATFYLQGVSRSFTHELIRHHVGTDYSQLSQRYVNSDAYETDGDPGYVVPPAMRGIQHLEEALEGAWLNAVADYKRAVDELFRHGKSRKEAREAARAFLPNCAETKIVVTGNHEAWRNVCLRRGSAQADAEIREVAVELLRQLKLLCPNLYQDLEICQGGDGITTVCQRTL